MLSSNGYLKDNNLGDSINLDKGNQLSEESKTDTDMNEHGTPAKVDESKKKGTLLQKMNITGMLKKKNSDSSDEPKVFQIPASGNIAEFSVDEMCQFFSCFNVSQHLLDTLRRKKVDGERFSRISDAELENLKLNNVVTHYFRIKCKKAATNFML